MAEDATLSGTPNNSLAEVSIGGRPSGVNLVGRVDEAAYYIRELTPAQIASLMSISDKLAGLNAARFSEWQPTFTPDNARQALLAFKGDVYTGLQAQDFNEADFDFAQQHLRMLSGLYGVLRPLDLLQDAQPALDRGADLQADAAGQGFSQIGAREHQLARSFHLEFHQGAPSRVADFSR